MQTGAKTGVGCYKCGKSGHWSRDCTVPKSQWISGPNAAGQANPSQQAPQSGTAETAAAEALPMLAAKKKRVQKPKLTFEVLQRPQDGLPVVFLTFAQRFKKKFKGKGHEGSDLRRLLEMYERWQRNLFPAISFDEFIAGVENIGRTGEVKKELRELRQGAIRMLEEEDEPEVPPSPTEVPAAPSPAFEAAPQQADATGALAEPGMLEEDWGVDANRPELDDEEYMMDSDLEDELFAMVHHGQPARQQTQVPPPQPADADCAMEDAGAQSESPRDAAPSVEQSGPLPPATGDRGAPDGGEEGGPGVQGGVSNVTDGEVAGEAASGAAAEAGNEKPGEELGKRLASPGEGFGEGKRVAEAGSKRQRVESDSE